MTTILDISETIEPQIIQGASIPYFNNIMIINGDTLDKDGLGIYYGDEIDLLFWESLGFVFNSGNTYTTIYTLIPGYIYRYYVGSRLFKIFDDTGSVIFTNTIIGINDFCIDFSVHKSHQFEIYNMSGDYNIGFYKPVKWRKRTHHSARVDIGDKGINNLWIPDRVRPYTIDDVDNPISGGVYAHLHNIDLGLRTDVVDSEELFDIDDLYGFMLSEIDYSNVNINNDMYTIIPYSKESRIPDWDIFGVKQDYDVVIPKLSIDMFPALLPIQLVDQQTNNRPLYEPWLIWKTLEFLTSNVVVDPDTTDIEAFTFDLSPWWA